MSEPAAGLQVQFHIKGAGDGIGAVGFDLAETNLAVEGDRIFHDGFDGIEAHALVTDPASLGDDAFGKHAAESLAAEGFRIVSSGTDTHLMLVDVFTKKVTGRQAQETLERASITVNKNAIPFDANPPAVASGIRVGTPAVTTRGMKEPEMRQIARWMAEVLNHLEDEAIIQRVRSQVESLTEKFPLYENRRVAVATKS